MTILSFKAQEKTNAGADPLALQKAGKATLKCSSDKHVQHLHWSYLNRGRPESKQLIASTLSVAVHVDQDVDSISMDTVCCFSIAGNLNTDT